MNLEDKAREYVDNHNPFVAGRAEIVMRKHWLIELMASFAAECVAEERARMIDDLVQRGILTRCGWCGQPLPPAMGSDCCSSDCRTEREIHAGYLHSEQECQEAKDGE